MQTSLFGVLAASSAVMQIFGPPANANAGKHKRAIGSHNGSASPHSFEDCCKPTANAKEKKVLADTTEALVRSYQLTALCTLPVMAFDVAVENVFELGHNRFAAQSRRQLPVHIHRSNGIFKRAWQADAEVGVL